MEAIFYRVGHVSNQQGLWYSPNGEFVGLIHKQFNFCLNNQLQMPYEPEIVGWLSATQTIDELLAWFPIEDIQRLETRCFSIMKYMAVEFKQHANHWVINQQNSILLENIYCDSITNEICNQ